MKPRVAIIEDQTGFNVYCGLNLSKSRMALRFQHKSKRSSYLAARATAFNWLVRDGVVRERLFAQEGDA